MYIICIVQQFSTIRAGSRGNQPIGAPATPRQKHDLGRWLGTPTCWHAATAHTLNPLLHAVSASLARRPRTTRRALRGIFQALAAMPTIAFNVICDITYYNAERTVICDTYI